MSVHSDRRRKARLAAAAAAGLGGLAAIRLVLPAGTPHPASSRKYAAAGTSTTPSASTSRYGSNKSPVASSDPPSGITSRDRSRGASPSVIMIRDRSHQDSHPSAHLRNLSP